MTTALDREYRFLIQRAVKEDRKDLARDLWEHAFLLEVDLDGIPRPAHA